MTLLSDHGLYVSYQLCFLVIFGDVSIIVEPKYLWVGVKGQTTDIVNVALVGAFLRGIVQLTFRKPFEREIENTCILVCQKSCL